MSYTEQEKIIPQVLHWLGVKESAIVSLLKEAKENDITNWQEEIFYILQERVQDEDDFLLKIDNSSFSQLWQRIDKLEYEQKLIYFLQRILNWDSEKIAKLRTTTIEHINQQLVNILETLSL